MAGGAELSKGSSHRLPTGFSTGALAAEAGRCRGGLARVAKVPIGWFGNIIPFTQYASPAFSPSLVRADVRGSGVSVACELDRRTIGPTPGGLYQGMATVADRRTMGSSATKLRGREVERVSIACE